MSDTSTRLTLPLIAAAQAQKHVTHNEAIMRLDGLVQMTALSYTTSAQPGSPSDGDLYLLPAGKTGSDWGSYTNHAVAHYYDGIWHQYHPNEGWLCFVQDTNILYYYTGSAWSAVPATGVADGSVSAPGLPFSSDADTGLYRIGANNIGVAAGGSKVLDIKSTGINKPLQPAFLALHSTNDNNVTGDGTNVDIVFDTEEFDQGGNYNDSTGVFTAPVDGKYLFSAVVGAAGMNSASFTRVRLFILTTARNYFSDTPPSYETVNNSTPCQLMTLCDMSASDTASVRLQVAGGTKTAGVRGNGTDGLTYFSGCLMA